MSWGPWDWVAAGCVNDARQQLTAAILGVIWDVAALILGAEVMWPQRPRKGSKGQLLACTSGFSHHSQSLGPQCSHQSFEVQLRPTRSPFPPLLPPPPVNTEIRPAQ